MDWERAVKIVSRSAEWAAAAAAAAVAARWWHGVCGRGWTAARAFDAINNTEVRWVERYAPRDVRVSYDNVYFPFRFFLRATLVLFPPIRQNRISCAALQADPAGRLIFVLFRAVPNNKLFFFRFFRPVLALFVSNFARLCPLPFNHSSPTISAIRTRTYLRPFSFHPTNP